MKRKAQSGRRADYDVQRTALRKKTGARARKEVHDEKAVAAAVLIEGTEGADALSHSEKRAAVRLLTGTPDGELPRMSRHEADVLAEKPHVRDVLVEALAKIGVNPDKLAQVIADGLNANETKFFHHEGMVTDARDVIDHNVRHKFVETAIEVMGAKPRETSAPPVSGNVFIFRSHLSGKPIDVKIGAPTDVVVQRRLAASKVRNRSGI